MMATTMTRLDPLRLLLVDDQPPVREAVRRRLEMVPRFKVVGEAGDIHEALAQLGATRPHLAVIDIGLRKNHQKESGLLLARVMRERYPETRALIWSEHDEADYVAEAKAAGVRGYVLKNRPTEEIVRAIEVVAEDGCYYSAGLEQEAVPKSQLTMREMQVLKLLAGGKSSRQIAKQLKINCRTVETHRRNLLSKLDAKNTVDAIIIAFRLGLIDFLE